MWLHRLDDADAACGGKAVGLARLVRAGLPVPDGFVIDDGAFRHLVGDLAIDAAARSDGPAPIGFVEAPRSRRPTIGHVLAEAGNRIASGELPDDFVRGVEARAAALGILAVRSSATIEDGEAGAAAGVFSSRTAVPAADVWAAIRAVWASALTPLAAAYARRRGGRISIGVIVQRFVPGELVTIYTRPPGRPAKDELVIQRGATTAAMPRPTAAMHPGTGVTRLAVLAIEAEQALGASGGADVEIIRGLVDAPAIGADGDRIRDPAQHAPATTAGGESIGEDSTIAWIVQARPIVHPIAKTRLPPPPTVTAPLVADGRTWTWDVAHNPDPLSLAQSALVERVDRARIAPWSLRVCAGFLYAARHEDARAPHVVGAPHSVAMLDARVAELERAMAAALRGERALTIAEAIERYLAFYKIWSTELAPLIAAARLNLSPTQLVGARPSSVESTLFAAARGDLDEAAVLDRIGVLSPAWDVAVPTFAERPDLVRAAIDRARTVVADREATSRVASDGPARTVVADREATSRAKSDDARERSTRSSGEVDAGEPSRDVVDGRAQGSAAVVTTASLHHQARVHANHAERDLARAAADLAERDDIWFARAQLLVRTAILARAQALGIDADDAFWIPLDELIATEPDTEATREPITGEPITREPAAREPITREPITREPITGREPIVRGPTAREPTPAARALATSVRPTPATTPHPHRHASALDPDDVRRRASAARNAAARAAEWAMPIVVGGEPADPAESLRGVGTGPRITGRVVRFASLASAVVVGGGDVVVTRAVTPALAVLVIGCAALVSESGGLLDHGAALARELEIPCVVGCRDAWSVLTDGMVVTVDGDAGEVTINSTQ